MCLRSLGGGIVSQWRSRHGDPLDQFLASDSHDPHRIWVCRRPTRNVAGASFSGWGWLSLSLGVVSLNVQYLSLSTHQAQIEAHVDTLISAQAGLVLAAVDLNIPYQCVQSRPRGPYDDIQQMQAGNLKVGFFADCLRLICVLGGNSIYTHVYLNALFLFPI